MGKSLLEVAAPIALGATGFGLAGALPSLGAGAGTAGAGLGLTGAAGNALAAQGAAGLLGSAGATAAGYGAGTAGALGATAANATQALMGDGVTMGNTITADGLTLNPLTGGYDAFNPLQRGFHALSNVDMGGKGMQIAQQGIKMMTPSGEPASAPAGAIQPPRPMQAPQGSFMDSANMNPMQIDDMIKRKNLMAFQGR
jgi:hypothetical protein